MGYSANHSTKFVVYDMPKTGSEYQLSKTRIESASVDELFRAFREAGRVPKKDVFLNILSRKMRARVYLDLDLAK